MTELRLWLSPNEPIPGVVGLSATDSPYRYELDLLPETLRGHADEVFNLLRHQLAVADIQCLEIRWLESGVGAPAGAAIDTDLQSAPSTDCGRRAQLLLEVPAHIAEDPSEVAASLGLRPIAATWKIDRDFLATHPRPRTQGARALPRSALQHAPPHLTPSTMLTWPDEDDDGRVAELVEYATSVCLRDNRGTQVLGPTARRGLLQLPAHEVVVLLASLGPDIDAAVEPHTQDLRSTVAKLRYQDLARLRRGPAVFAVAALAVLEQILEDAVLSTDDSADHTFLREAPRVARYRTDLSLADPRTSTLLDIGLTDQTIELLPPAVQPRALRSIWNLETELRSWEALTLEGSVVALIEAALPERADAVPMLARRFGSNGLGVSTLDEVGKDLGVTRERVRQLQGKAEQRLPRAWLACPALDQTLEVLRLSLPCTPAQLATHLREGGLTELNEWHAPALNAVAARFGRQLDAAQLGELVVWNTDMTQAKAVLVAARRLAGFAGLTSLARVSQEVVETGDDEAGFIRAVLEAAPDVHWLDASHFWTDHPVGRNRLVNTCLRIMTVISPQALDDIYEGVTRNFNWRALTGAGRFAELVAPQPDLLMRFLADHPAFEVLPGDRVGAVERPTMESLGPEKLAMVGVLLAEPDHLMHRNQLLAGCIDAGMNTATAGVFTTYAEVLKRFAPNVWGLRGAPVTPAAIERVQRQAKVDRAEVDSRRLHGRTPSGRPWTAQVITPTFRYSGVLTSEWALPELRDRSLRLVDASDGDDAGMLRFSDNFNYGYSTLLGRHRPEIGSVIRVVADPHEDYALVEFGHEELLEEPFDW